MAEKMNPGARPGATGARVFAEVVNTSPPEHTAIPLTMKAARVIFEGEEGPVSMKLMGRELWALRELIRAGARGVTPIDRPAPRWSHYVFQLRARGLSIETIREEHGGDYPGHHGRYVLRTPVAIGGGA